MLYPGNRAAASGPAATEQAMLPRPNPAGYMRIFGVDSVLAWIVHANLLRTRIALHLSPLCQNADLDGFQHACARQPVTTG